jgi:hypothetical protein
MALIYSPALVIWTGIATVTAWSAGFLWVANLPDSIPHTSRDMLDRGLSAASVISSILDPRAVSLTILYKPDRLSRPRHRDPDVDGLALAAAGAPAGGG